MLNADIPDQNIRSDKQLLLDALLKEKALTGDHPMLHWARWHYLPDWNNDPARIVAAVRELMNDGTIVDIKRPGSVILNV